MNICEFQFNSVWQDSQQNLLALNNWCEKYLHKGECDLLVLPETFHAGFSMNPSTFAESKEGEISQALAAIARQYECYVVAGVAQKQVRRDCHGQQISFYNRALCFNRQGELQADYAKQKLFSFAGEHKAFKAGFKPEIIQIDGQPFALFICYDLRFPELFRSVAKQVKGFIVIANWPDSRQLHWETLLKARAIENQCFMLAVNRIGEDENGLSYAGGSMVVSPLGEVLAYGEKHQECVTASIDIAEVNKVREQFPFLNDME